MLTASKIIETCSKSGLSAYKTCFCFDEEIDICLASGDIHELIEIARKNNVNTIFYAFEHCDESDYLITDNDLLEEDEYEDFGELYASYLLRFKAEMISFNAGIDRKKLAEPSSLCVYILMAGLQVGIVQNNLDFSMLPDKNIILDNLYEILESNCHNEEEKAREREDHLRKEAMQRLIEYIDTTDDWKECTNQQLRRAYCQRIADEYRLKNGIRIYPAELFLEIEKRWNKYKEEKKNRNNSSKTK